MNSDSEDDPIEAFFHKYPSFSYRPSPDWRQLGPFHALAKHCQWSKERRKTELKRLKRTWTRVVESEFSGSSILYYQSLCEDLDIIPIPDTVDECKAVLKKVFVNIVDLMQYRTDQQKGRGATKPQKFCTLKQLKEYSNKMAKYYSKEEAKAEMLRELLKVLKWYT